MLHRLLILTPSLCIAAAIVFSLCFRGGGADERDLLRVEPSNVEVRRKGKTSSSATESLTFQITNDTSDAVRIVGLATTCSCIAADDLIGHNLQPGEVCRFPVTVTMPLYGEKDVRVEISTSSSMSPVLQSYIRILGLTPTLPTIMEQPERLDLEIPASTVHAGVSGKLRFRLEEFSHTKPALNGMKRLGIGLEEVSTTLLSEEPSKTSGVVVRSYECELTLNAYALDQVKMGGSYYDRVYVDVAAEEEFDGKPIGISVRVIPDVRAVPSSLYFRLDAHSASKIESKTCVLRWATGIKPKDVLHIATSQPWIVAKLSQSSAGDTSSFVPLRIDINASAIPTGHSSGKIQEKITVCIDAVTEPIEIPVYVDFGG